MRTLVLGLLLIGLGAPLAPSDPAMAADRPLVLDLLALRCRERSPEPNDVIGLRVKGDFVFVADMAEGDVDAVDQRVPFRKKVKVFLFEDPDGLIGTVKVDREMLGAGVQTRTIRAADGPGEYVLSFKVVAA